MGIEVTIKINNNILDKVARATETALLKSASIVEASAIINSPTKSSTLIKSWSKKVVGNDAFVFNNVEYSFFVETSGKNPRRRGRIPFLQPALDENKSRINAIFDSEYKKATK